MKADASGVYPMLVPFYTADDRVDHALWRPQVDAAVRHGCHGIGVMGLGTEVNKLSSAERREVVRSVAEALGGRLPLSVTVGENTVRGQIEFARFAVEHGAAWLILQPPSVSDLPEIELLRFFGAVADAVPVPIAVQNAAIYLGIQLTAAGLVSLHRQHPNISLLKTEDPPDVTARLIEETGGVLRVFVGRGGLDMIDELRAGAVGIIPGVETIDRTARIFDAFRDGREVEAEAAYGEILPTLVYVERSINHFVTASREILARRLGVAPVRHRLGKDLGDFGREMVARCSRSLGPLAAGDAAGVSS
ncbi:dihydrodipicolinate synthase family protein [Aquisphaera insulae]|uniref:dihydrodipicolinate synthase family protein n=1 Tax=Aquisphaera insulae TaxID=2712864 RepID=UPI0013E9F5B0|nr:dihydrodipicolinate synthase family protein [Aquisphaera insulae]